MGKVLLNQLNFLLWQGHSPSWPKEAFLFCNFIKALGAVSHSVFLRKLFITHLDKFTGHGVSTGLLGGAQGVIVHGATSAWQSVTSTVSHGSVLGPVLFSVFINYPDTGIKCTWRKFAGKQELWHLQGQRSLQRDLESWIVSNHMKFSKGKCHILRLGWDNPGCLSGHQWQVKWNAVQCHAVKLHQGSSPWTLGTDSSLRRWSVTGTGSSGKWSLHQTCQN